MLILSMCLFTFFYKNLATVRSFLSCMIFSNILCFLYVFRAFFVLNIAFLISSFHQRTLGFFIWFVELPIDFSAAEVIMPINVLTVFFLFDWSVCCILVIWTYLTTLRFYWINFVFCMRFFSLGIPFIMI